MLTIDPSSKKILIPYAIDRQRFPNVAEELRAFGFDLTQPFCGLDCPELSCHVYRQPPLDFDSGGRG